MAVYGDPRQGDAGRILADAAGTPLATFTARPTPERPWADAFRPVRGADLAQLAAAAVTDLPGVRLRTDPGTAEALVGAGAVVVRHTHRLRRDLNVDAPPVEWAAPDLPEGLSLVAVDPADVPDSPVGALLDDPSGQVVDGDGRVLGAILVRHRAIAPLVDHLAPIPDVDGIAAALLQRALVVCSLADHDHLAAIVPDGGPAAVLFAALGFVETAVDVTLDLPGTHPAWR